MRLTTEYREETTGILKGTKQFFLVCHVEFNQAEKAIAQERGLYDSLSITVPAATPPPTRAGDFVAFGLRLLGIIIMPVGLLASCGSGLAHYDSNTVSNWFYLFILGVVLFTIGKLKDRKANRRAENPDQILTLRKLLTNPDIIVWAETVQIGKHYEEVVREELQVLAHSIRDNAVVSEQNTYEL